METSLVTYDNYNLEEIWRKCKNILKEEMTSVHYESFISDLVLLDIKDGFAHIEVKHEFSIGILESKYVTQIKDSFISCANISLNPKFYKKGTYVKEEEKVDEPSDLYSDGFESNLNPKYTFDSFIIGNSNRMAYAAAVAISDSPGVSYNPLFIYGQSGLGKTHLLHAIGNQIKKEFPEKKVLYITSEKFTNEFVNAIQHKKNEEFRNKYRTIDVLLIDDIQFISRMERTQEEFFYTFNALYEDKKQIVVSCDTPLNKIQVLEERLRTRFAWGLITDIQAPDFETKVAILSKKASEIDIEVENEVLDYIAYSTGDNIRELEGVINHLSMSLSQGKEITLNLAKEALRHLQRNDIHEVNAGVIIDSVSRYFKISVDDLLSQKRTKEFAFSRQIAMYLCKELTEMSFPKIGETFNGRHHSTVMYAYEQISKQVDKKVEIKKIIEELKNNLLEKF